jgi:hypothetical protein
MTPGVFDSVTVYGLSGTLEGLQVESTYHITVRGFDAEGHPSWFAWDYSGSTMLGVSSSQDPVAGNQGKFSFQPASPNPVNKWAKIVYQMPADGHLRLDVCNINGQVVKNLIDGQTVTGRHEIFWKSDNNLGKNVSNGIYFFRARVQGEMYIQKIMVLR